jgi:PAS domain S-box-containing protein
MAETLKTILDLVEQNKILEKRNEELKKIIDINLSQPDLDPEIPIKELFATTENENLVLQFYRNHKIPVAIFSITGDILFSVGWKKVFSNKPNFEKSVSCFEAIISQINQKPREKHYTYKCKNSFYTISCPLEIKGNKKGLLVLNQFLLSDDLPEKDIISGFAKDFNIKENDVPDILRDIPAISKKQLSHIITQATTLAEMISFIGSKNFEFCKKFKQQINNNTLLKALKEKISEQEQVIQVLHKTITEHQKEIGENTISKTLLKKETQKLSQKLSRTENMLHILLTSMPISIYFITEGIITFTNDQANKLTGYTPKETIGRPYDFLFPENKRENINIKLISSIGKEHCSFNTQIIKKDGGLYDVIAIIAPMYKNKHHQSFTLSLIDKDVFEIRQHVQLMHEKVPEY